MTYVSICYIISRNHETTCEVWLIIQHCCVVVIISPSFHKTRTKTDVMNNSGTQCIALNMNLIINSTKEVILSVWFVCFSVGLQKKHWPGFYLTWWKGATWAKGEPITFWRGSQSQGRYTNCFSLTLTL